MRELRSDVAYTFYIIAAIALIPIPLCFFFAGLSYICCRNTLYNSIYEPYKEAGILCSGLLNLLSTLVIAYFFMYKGILFAYFVDQIYGEILPMIDQILAEDQSHKESFT